MLRRGRNVRRSMSLPAAKVGCPWRRGETCSVGSRSSTVVRPRCGSSTRSASSTPPVAIRSRRSRCTPTPRARRSSSARPTSATRSARPSARPYLNLRVLERALTRDRRRRGLGRLGLRRRAPGLRRAVRPARRHLHRPERRRRCARWATRSAPSCWPRRSGCRSRRGARGRSRTCDAALAEAEPARLPADAQGHRRRWRPRHPQGRARTQELTAAFDQTSDEAAARLRQRRDVPGDRWSPAPGTSRCR